jgi:hypothetical protein
LIYYLQMAETTSNDAWRQTHLGYLMGRALQRFDARVLALMAQNVEVPLALGNLAARGQVSAAHIHITRHLPLTGSRLTDLAASAGTPDTRDARARRVAFTGTGLAWLKAFEDAVAQTELELKQAVGEQVATVIAIGLEAYAA